MASPAVGVPPVDPKQKALTDYRKKLLEHREVEARLKEMREQGKQLQKDYDKSEDDLKALQSVGQVCLIVMSIDGSRYTKNETYSPTYTDRPAYSVY